MKAVTAQAISKLYEQGKKAVDKASFSIEQGEVFGFLGPNGAGKTTTVKLLSGMLTPTEGSCLIFDINPNTNPEQVHRISGIVTEHAQMYDNLTGIQNLIFYGTVFGMEAEISRRRGEQLLQELDLFYAKDKKLETYSTGMRQRLSLARSMIHSPKILFLDEPTSGLDPESAQSVNHMIRNLAREEGTTIFLCTHQLRYAQEVCTSYGLMDEGKLLAAGSIEELRSMVFSGMTVRIQTDAVPLELPFRKLQDQLYEIDLASQEEIPSIVEKIVTTGGRIYHVSAQRLSLEEIYFSLLNKAKHEKEAKA